MHWPRVTVVRCSTSPTTFHVRHQDANQKRDYDDFYLDWIFWPYLATIELTNRVIDEHAK
jgi:hypothetical protein